MPVVLLPGLPLGVRDHRTARDTQPGGSFEGRDRNRRIPGNPAMDLQVLLGANDRFVASPSPGSQKAVDRIRAVLYGFDIARRSDERGIREHGDIELPRLGIFHS